MTDEERIQDIYRIYWDGMIRKERVRSLQLYMAAVSTGGVCRVTLHSEKRTGTGN